jgi:galactokinase
MTGGGFGGSAVALVPADALEPVRRAVTAAFAEAGATPPAYLVATPGEAARVDGVS